MRRGRMRIAAVAAAWGGTLAAFGGRLAVDGPSRVFLGDFPADRSQTVRFELRNDGDSALGITGVSKACSCAEAEVGTNRVAPGATATITLRTVPGALVGPFSKSFFVMTTAPSREDRVLQLTIAGRGVADTGVSAAAPVAPAASNAASPVPTSEAASEAAPPDAGQATPSPSPRPGIPAGRSATVEFFVQEGCAECEQLRREFLPMLEARYKDRLHVAVSDTGERAAFLRLLEVLDSRGVTANEPLYMVVDGRRVLSGWSSIRRDGPAVLDAALALASAGPPATGAAPPDALGPAVLPSPAARLFERFGLAMVAAAGLADGLNPCAFATIVFLTTLLATGGRKGRAVFLGGLAFCLASFATYLLIGLGLLSALRRLESLAGLRRAVEWTTVAALAVLAVLSLLDAWRYARTGDARSVALQLPDAIKQRIRRFARARWNGPAVFVSGLICGAGVTLLESVCTGQMYLPTLVFMSREGGGARARLLLLLYNAAFILPLFAVFLLGALGIRSQRLADWTTRHLVPSKLLLAAVFLSLAVFLAFRVARSA